MSDDRLVSIVVSYLTEMIGKQVREVSGSLTDVKFMVFAARYAINLLYEVHLPDCKSRFGPKNDDCQSLLCWRKTPYI